MTQLGLKGRQLRVEQLLATVHICLLQIAGRLPMLDRVQSLDALLLTLRKLWSVAQPLAQHLQPGHWERTLCSPEERGGGWGELVFRGPWARRSVLAEGRLSWTAGCSSVCLFVSFCFCFANTLLHR